MVVLAIEDYISRAKKKRAEVLSRGKKKEPVVDNEKIMVSSNFLCGSWLMLIMFQLPIGKMYHCYKRGRGVHIRGCPPVNIIFNKNSSYQHMLERSIDHVGYSDDERIFIKCLDF